MFKAILIVAVVLGFAWSFPPTRGPLERITAPIARRAMPVVDGVLNPIRRNGAKRETTNLLRVIAQDFEAGRPLPDVRGFHQWVRRKTSGDGLDPWGSPYYMRRNRGTLSIGSAGPDKTPMTADDVRTTVPME